MTSRGTVDVDEIAKAYAFDGPGAELGALVVDGKAHSRALVRLPLSMMNRHGLVAGATGTGKTKTLQLMAEQLSTAGVPVFLADIKGDLSGMAAAGKPDDNVRRRASDIGYEWTPMSCPVEFFSLGGEGKGVPIRSTMTAFGPTLLAKVLGLNDVQESSLGLIFHYADKAGLPLLDLKDLRAVVHYLTSDEGLQELKDLGGLSRATAGVILRQLVAFETQGAEKFFGEPEFDTADLLRMAPDGRGIVSILELTSLQDRPALFSTFLMWLLADLYENLPEVGDLDKPKLVFFFDEAHLLFDGASKAFLDAIQRTIRLIRSKGIGVFFVTHTPQDVPADVLAQLGNRIQHALRAFTPQDAKALKATVSTYPTTGYDLGELLTQLGIGEAVVTVLTERGAPTPVAWTLLRAPQTLMAPCEEAVLDGIVAGSPLTAEYGQSVDRDSAYERLNAKLAAGAAAADAGAEPDPKPAKTPQPRGRSTRSPAPAASPLEKALETFAKSAASTLGREIMRGVFGTARRRRR